MKKLKVLDLCAGTGSATQAFVDRGHEVHKLDIKALPGIDIILDVRDAHFDQGIFDFIWTSPDCTCFSVAALHHHWKDRKPKPDTIEAIDIVKHCIRVIKEAKPTYWVLENPVGMLRTLDFMKTLQKKFFRSTVTYCQYGDTAMKPTDLWHNIPTFHPKKCKKGNSCHAPSPASHSTKGSSQWKTGSLNRARLPYRLSLEICKAVEVAMAEDAYATIAEMSMNSGVSATPAPRRTQ